MSAARAFAGIGGLALAAVPAAAVGILVVRRLPRRARPLQALAGSVVALATVLVASEVLGTVGLFAPVPLIVTLWAIAAFAYLWLRGRAGPAEDAAAVAPDTGKMDVPVLLAVGVTAVAVTGRWVAGTFNSLANGIRDFDSLHYHLPYAAEFVRTGRLTRLHAVWPDASDTVLPANSEVFQAVGMLTMGRDVLAPVPNLLWFALLALSGWCIGVRDRVAPLTLLAALWLAGIPVVWSADAGSALSDIAMLACFAAAVALWRNAQDDLGWTALAGLALGLSVGVKLTAIAPAAALTVAIVYFAPVRHRLRTAGALVGMLVVGGGFWYFRNLLLTGSPLPGLHLPLFSDRPLPLIDRFGFSVAHNLFKASAWRVAFRPGLHQFFGWAGVLAVAAALVGLARLRTVRPAAVIAMAACGVFGVIAYLVTPVSAWGFDGAPDLGLFIANLRYALPALLLLLMAAMLLLGGEPDRRRSWLAAGLLGAAVALETLHPGTASHVSARYAARGFAVAVAAAAAFATARMVPNRRPFKLAAVAAIGVGALLATPVLARHDSVGAVPGPDATTTRVYQWASTVRHKRVGFYALDANYPMYNRGWTNRLRFIGVSGPHGAFRAPGSCHEYVALLADEDFDFVVVGPSATYFQTIDLPAWTATQPGASVVLDAAPFTVFRVAGPYDPARCPAASPERAR